MTHPTIHNANVRRVARSQIVAVLVFVLTAGLLAGAQTTNDSSSTDYSTFQIIVDRNIFNPDRYARSSHHHESAGVPTLSLAGTMSYRKGMYAFFNGTEDNYRKALQQGGTIAGFTVENITFDGVQLKSTGKTIDLKVGAALRREGDGWELSAPGEWGDLSGAEAAPGAETMNDTSPTNLPSSIGQNDILKRLMEQREEQEQK